MILCNTGNIPVITVNTTFHAGSKNETSGKTGLAHLFEHLMFEGSPNIPRGKFDEILNKNGGESNAYTTKDITSYYITAPSNHLETALWLDSDRLSGFAVSQKSLDIQKDVIIEEKLMYVDNSPYGTLDELSSKKLFGNTPYGWSVIGSMEDIREMKLSDLEKFYHDYYSPENAVVTITGDIDYNHALDLSNEYYGTIKGKEKNQKSEFKIDSIEEEIYENITDNVHLDGLFIFYRIPPAGTKDFYAMKILSGILSSGESSRLYRELEYKNQLVSEIDTVAVGMENAGMFMISAIASNDVSGFLIKEKIDTELSDILNGNVNDKEFEKVKNNIESRFSSRLQSMVAIADRFSYLKTIRGDCSKINFEILDYLSVTKQDVIEAANKYLKSNQRLILHYTPKQ